MIFPASVEAARSSIGYLGVILLLGIGVLATIGQLLMTEGYHYIEISIGSVIILIGPVLNIKIG